MSILYQSSINQTLFIQSNPQTINPNVLKILFVWTLKQIARQNSAKEFFKASHVLNHIYSLDVEHRSWYEVENMKLHTKVGLSVCPK